jgi:predicted metal-dependent HD superfamily phosphohydrolase
MNVLSKSWVSAWCAIGAADPGAALCEEVLMHYAEPHRKYHNEAHLRECLARLDTARALAEHPDEIAIALMFHDVFYDVYRHDNEERSAEWARSAAIAAGAPADVATRIYWMIMATRHQATPVQVDEQLLVDIDLSILGAEERRFNEYEQQIREEYAHVPEAVFCIKRRAILQGFVDRPRIYLTEPFFSLCEQAARGNLQRSTALLERGS